MQTWILLSITVLVNLQTPITYWFFNLVCLTKKHHKQAFLIHFFPKCHFRSSLKETSQLKVLHGCIISVKSFYNTHALGRLSCSRPNVWELLSQGDVDGDGHLDYGEFVAISVHLRKMGNDEHLRKAFQFFDQNKSEYIEIEELRSALSDDLDTNSEEVISAIMHDVDTDKVSSFLFLPCRSSSF